MRSMDTSCFFEGEKLALTSPSSMMTSVSSDSPVVSVSRKTMDISSPVALQNLYGRFRPDRVTGMRSRRRKSSVFARSLFRRFLKDWISSAGSFFTEEPLSAVPKRSGCRRKNRSPFMDSVASGLK